MDAVIGPRPTLTEHTSFSLFCHPYFWRPTAQSKRGDKRSQSRLFRCCFSSIQLCNLFIGIFDPVPSFAVECASGKRTKCQPREQKHRGTALGTLETANSQSFLRRFLNLIIIIVHNPLSRAPLEREVR